jgi:2-oxoisovalerate dehydrogenase E1 component alpha subunit
LQHGGKNIPLTSVLRIVSPDDVKPTGTWPAYRILDENGTVRTEESVDEKMDYIPAGTKFDIQSILNALQYRHPSQFDFLSNLKLFHNLERAYKQMIRLRQMDDVLQNAQRQGRISFYMTCRGEEAIHIGSASALEMKDVILAQYREAGVLMWRGFTLEQFANQCFSNDLDLGKGR